VNARGTLDFIPVPLKFGFSTLSSQLPTLRFDPSVFRLLALSNPDFPDWHDDCFFC